MIVVGAGVSGLTCAHVLASAGHRVRIWARHATPRTTSSVAAAFWYPYAVHPRARVLGWATESYTQFRRLADDPATGVRMRPVIEVARGAGDMPWWADAVPGVRVARPDELPPGCDVGFAFQAPVIDTRKYLPWLEAEVRARGVTIETREVRTLEEALGAAPVVIDCAGLGARELASDPAVHPIRGQLVLVPDHGLASVIVDDDAPDGPAYAVPRGDDIVLGGTLQPHDDDVRARPEESRAIVERCGRLVPELATARPLADAVGLRPGRHEVRLEVSSHEGGTVIHDYGHGGAGITLSWGCAAEVGRLVQDALSRSEAG